MWKLRAIRLDSNHAINIVIILALFSGSSAIGEEQAPAKILNHAASEVGDFGEVGNSQYQPFVTRQGLFEQVEIVALHELECGKFEVAIRHLKLVAKAEPENVKYRIALSAAHVQYADVLRAKHEEQKAISEYQTALTINVNNEKAKKALRELGCP